MTRTTPRDGTTRHRLAAAVLAVPLVLGAAGPVHADRPGGEPRGQAAAARAVEPAGQEARQEGRVEAHEEARREEATRGTATPRPDRPATAAAQPTASRTAAPARRSVRPATQPRRSAPARPTGPAPEAQPRPRSTGGTPSDDGRGDGEAKGRPCAGCVGDADDKTPRGQAPDGSDRDAGYECDRNQGIGRSNPAHTGCAASPSPTAARPAPVPSAASPTGPVPPAATPTPDPERPATCRDGSALPDSGGCDLPTTVAPPTAPPVSGPAAPPAAPRQGSVVCPSVRVAGPLHPYCATPGAPPLSQDVPALLVPPGLPDLAVVPDGGERSAAVVPHGAVAPVALPRSAGLSGTALPRTGGETVLLAGTGGLMVLTGAGLLVAVLRRRPAR